MLVAFGGVSDRNLFFSDYQFSFRHFGSLTNFIVFKVQHLLAKLNIVIGHVSSRPFEFIFHFV